ncbi:MAG: Asp-tRNA(Asn)/Glu-tRNA(Gln) amidotransferase subunit GatC [Gammaproteobacteria bacterium]
MSLEHSDIKNIAWLARLELKEEEIPGYQQELDGILGLVEQMKSVETGTTRPLAHPLDINARLRPDLITETDQREKFQGIAPDVDKGYYLVPKVIE